MSNKTVRLQRRGLPLAVAVLGCVAASSANAAMTISLLERGQQSVTQAQGIVYQAADSRQAFYAAPGLPLADGTFIRGSSVESIELSCGDGSRLLASGAFQLTVTNTNDCTVYLQAGQLTAVATGNAVVQTQAAVASSSSGIFEVRLQPSMMTMVMLSGDGAFDYHNERYPVDNHSKMGLSSDFGLTIDSLAQGDGEQSAELLARLGSARSGSAAGQDYQTLKSQYLAGFGGNNGGSSAASVIPVERYTLEVELSAEVDPNATSASISATPAASYRPGQDPLDFSYEADVTSRVLDNLGNLQPATDQYGRPVQ